MVTILLPAYNEEESFAMLMPKLQRTMQTLNTPFLIVVCNDGSSDRTKELLGKFSKELPIKVIHHKLNRGLGETSRDLFEYAAETCDPDDIIIRMDCDDTHEPNYIPEMIKKLDKGFDVVIASRFQPGGGQLGLSPYKAFISYCANLFMKLFFPIKGIREYSCGFRAYRASKIQEAISFYGDRFIQLKGMGFTCTLEKIIKLRLLGARFAEVPFCLYYNQKLSTSKMVGNLTTFGYIVMVIMYYWPWGGWRTLKK
ncbi:MAG: glycosyltransferase family 2 protein [Nitrospina sp.]|nr:glycosyltransferase family 2 protein [Nitrospina sp.]